MNSVADFATFGTLAGTIATAIATFFLWRVTRVLATETKRMADASSQPQVVASIVPNSWSTIHADLTIENTGNASAFDVEVKFDPPLENDEIRGEDRPIPFQNVSVLKPGQSLTSYLSGIGPYLDKSFLVEVSWKRSPTAKDRQSLSYTYSMTDYSGVTYLGARNPTVQIAEQLKKIREDWKGVASGQKRLKNDIFTSADERRERERREQQHEQIKKHLKAQEQAKEDDSTS